LLLKDKENQYSANIGRYIHFPPLSLHYHKFFWFCYLISNQISSQLISWLTKKTALLIPHATTKVFEDGLELKTILNEGNPKLLKKSL
jgi:hypothetical protein